MIEHDEKKWTCERCGKCCMHMHSDDTGMPCECLLVEGGIATCLIQESKPDYCKEYPESNNGMCKFMDYKQISLDGLHHPS